MGSHFCGNDNENKRMTTNNAKKHISFKEVNALKKLFKDNNLHTVCQSAKCPNIAECFNKQTATFMILGDICTRGCAFCGVTKASPLMPNPEEAENLAKIAKKLNLRYCVITSVTRDDLPDGGSKFFFNTITMLRNENIKVEVLVPDFGGNLNNVDIVLKAKPTVFAHNIETVPSLYASARPNADYARSLQIIAHAKNKGALTKSAIMVGLGEKLEELKQTIIDLKRNGCDILALGQYLSPTKESMSVEKYYSDNEFKRLKEFALKAGFKSCVAGKFVRSSYLAAETYHLL